ncbi:hypothetical protein AAFM71_07525 [Chromobacterium violaceum]|uniref:hypothetical protein n=1 Tax=Chromobacterium violaceum TaxID=536 RepID=UPI003858DC81
MSEIVNPHEQLQMAAEAAGYLGELDEDSGERDWLYPHCDCEDWNPRESIDDAAYLILALGLLVEVDREAETVTVVIDGQYQVEHAVMVESFMNGSREMDAFLMAVTRAAAEIGRCKTKEVA